MITIEYCGSGKPVDDCLAERFVTNMLESVEDSGKDKWAKVSTENVIQAALTMIIRDGIEVRFVYKNEILIPNKYGALHNWPKGFCDLTNRLVEERIRLAMKKRKEERENDM